MAKKKQKNVVSFPTGYKVEENGVVKTEGLAVTPVAPANYIYLASPDTKYEPKYCYTLRFDPENNPEHKAYVEALMEVNEAVGQSLLKGITKGRKAYRIKDLLVAEEDDSGEPTGAYTLKVTTKHPPKVKDTQSPKPQEVPDSIIKQIGSGSKLRALISFRASVVNSQKTVGLTAYLASTQLVELKTFTSSGDGDDFGSIEGGFVAPAAADDEGFEGDF